MPTDTLAEEREYYLKRKAELLEHYPGKYALIKGQELLAVFDTQDAAYAEGLKRLGNVPMLVVRIQAEEPVAWFPALQLGLIGAHIQE